jgi:hypothetical protein
MALGCGFVRGVIQHSAVTGTRGGERTAGQATGARDACAEAECGALTAVGADGHVIEAAAAPPHLMEWPQHNLTLARRNMHRSLAHAVTLLSLLAPVARAQPASMRELLPVVATSLPDREEHYLWVATRVGSTDSVHIRLLIVTHGAPGWTATDSAQRARIGVELQALREGAKSRGSSFAFLMYGSGSVVVEHAPPEAGFTLNGERWDWSSGDSVLVLSVDRIDGVGGAREVRSARIVAPFDPRIPARAFQATVGGVVSDLERDGAVGPLLRPSSARR